MTRTRVRTTRRLRGVLALLPLLASLATLPAAAAPPYQRFLQGLRDRRYDDIALYYLDQLAADPAVPPEVKDVLDYERAATLIGMSRSGSDPNTQARQLEEATAALERFISAHPDHPLVARALSARGEILLQRARVSIMEGASPGNEGRAGQLQDDARTSIAKAREIFENARQRYEQQWKAYGPYVDSEDELRKKEKNDALNALIQARLHLADCTYREAQSYPVGQPKRNELLTAAAKEYEAIHADYRSQIGGLYARLWMAKCYEEQAPRPGDGNDLTPEAVKDARQKLNIAEAIYSELLEHDMRSSAAGTRMQDFAFWFKLIVRNHPALGDHQLVLDQAIEWLKTRTGQAAQTVAALGVRWERARAYETLAGRRDQTEEVRTRFLRSALADAEFVNAYPGEYRDVSRSMIQRVKATFGRGQSDPRDFDEANGLASTLFNQNGEKQEAVKKAKGADRAAAEQALAAHLDETARILKLALSFAGPGTDRQAVNRARYRLAYVELVRDRPYDAAVLGDYIARKFKDESPGLALEAAYLALAAYHKLYVSTPADQPRDFELSKVKEQADFIATAYPDSEQANDARMTLGEIYLNTGDYAQAAQWFSKVPESSAQGMDARLLAGRMFWEAYATALTKPEADRPDQAGLDQMRSDAEKFLREGLATAAAKLPQDAEPPENVVAAKVTLAQIRNLDGKYQEAVDLINGGPQSVAKLVAVDDPKVRPKTGVKSAPFASLVHQQLLRSYIGLQQMDPAINEMRMLEQIGGGNTAVFVQLGQQIKAELEGLPAGQARDAVMTAFDQFLGNLSQMQQGQTFGSLLWIGETYFGLAQAAAEPKRGTYFDRAAASYETILKRANEANFLPNTDAVNGVRLRLAAVQKSRGEFAKAYDLALQVLRSAPRALNAQVETAAILAEWGASGRPEAPDKLLLAVQGDPSDPKAAVWGWGQIAKRLQKLVAGPNPDEDQAETYRRARYEIPAALRAYARTQSGAKKSESLEKAKKELLAYTATTPKEEIGELWWAKFNGLWADIQRDQGLAVVKPLEPAKQYVRTAAPADAPESPTAVAAAGASKAGSKAKIAPKKSSGNGVLSVLLGLSVAALVGAGIVWSMMKGGRNNRRVAAASSPVELPVFAGVGAEAEKPVRVKSAMPRPVAKTAELPTPPSEHSAGPVVPKPTRPAPTSERPVPPASPIPGKSARRVKPGE